MTDPVRRHPVMELAARNSLAAELLDEVVPEYFVRTQTRDRARELAATARRTADNATVVPWPAAADQVTTEWLDAECIRRRTANELDLKLEVLRQVEFDSHQEAGMLVDDHAEDLIRALAVRFDDLTARLSDAVDGLDGARTAAEAIDADAAAPWKQIRDARAEYDVLRNVQRTLYRCRSGMFDDLKYGGGVANIDPEARMYFHRRLPEVAPHWRGGGTDSMMVSQSPQVPWPDDPTEALVWFIAHDSGIWCPTPNQLKALDVDVAPRLPLRRHAAQLTQPRVAAGR